MAKIEGFRVKNFKSLRDVSLGQLSGALQQTGGAEAQRQNEPLTPMTDHNDQRWVAQSTERKSARNLWRLWKSDKCARDSCELPGSRSQTASSPEWSDVWRMKRVIDEVRWRIDPWTEPGASISTIVCTVRLNRNFRFVFRVRERRCRVPTIARTRQASAAATVTRPVYPPPRWKTVFSRDEIMAKIEGFGVAEQIARACPVASTPETNRSPP